MPFDVDVPGSNFFLKEASSRRPIDVHVGKRLTKRREELGFGCMFLAQKTMLTEAALRSFEGGYTRIYPRDLLNISEALDINISFFYAE